MLIGHEKARSDGVEAGWVAREYGAPYGKDCCLSPLARLYFSYLPRV
jgi:hypothetical protein